MHPIGRATLLAVVVVVLGGCDGAGPTPTSTPAATPAPHGPSAAGDAVSQVTFMRDGLDLHGDLRLPGGAGPHPGVVLVHGSGPLDRDGTIPGQLAMTFARPVDVFTDLAAGLRDAGYAVLTYDKRTCGPFNGCADNGYPRPPDDLTIDAFTADAQAAVEHLRSVPDVDPDAVAVAGHSQGATFVPGMLLDDPRLMAGIMLSAPYEPIDDLLARQADTVDDLVARMDPQPAGAADDVVRLRRLARSVGRLRAGGGGDDRTPLGGATVGFWRSWVRVSDGVPQLAQQAEQPLLVLTGAADTNIGEDQTALWYRDLTQARGRTAPAHDRVVQLDCVSHALNCLGTDDPLAVDPEAIDSTVDPRVVARIAAFLDTARSADP